MNHPSILAEVQEILASLNMTYIQLHKLSLQLLNESGDEDARDFHSTSWTKQPAYVLGLILGFVAITLNCLSLLAIFHIKHKLSTHFLLIASLATSDILTGISLTMHILVHQPSACTFLIIKALNCTGLILCLLHLAGMATDHYTAILYPLQHSQLMCRRNGLTLIILFWIFGLMLGFSKFYAEAHNIGRIQKKFQVGFCQSVWITRYQEEYCMFAIAFITLSMMTYIYIRIYVKIARHKSPGNNGSPSQDSKYRTISPSKHRRALVTTLLILGSFILCWVPTCVYEVTLIIQVKVDRGSVETSEVMLTMINDYLFNLLLINTVLDPIIYASRLNEIQSGYRTIFNNCSEHRACFMRRVSSNVSKRSISTDIVEDIKI